VTEVLEVRRDAFRCLGCGKSVNSEIRRGRPFRMIAAHRGLAGTGPTCHLSGRRFVDGATVRLVLATGPATFTHPTGPIVTLTNAEISFMPVPKPAPEPSQWRQKTRPKIK
jgi:hypothetical protein